MDVRRAAALRRNVQVADGRDAVEPVLKRGESRRLGKQHEQSIHALIQVRIALGLEELHAEIYKIFVNDVARLESFRRLTGKDRGLEELNELIDLNKHIDRHLQVGAEKVSGDT